MTNLLLRFLDPEAGSAVGTATSSCWRVMVSDPSFGNSLTVRGAASSNYSLEVMSVAALILLPLVLFYQGWTYYVFRRRLGGQHAAPTPGAETPIAVLDPPAAP